jgi:hypothetical protein
MSMIVLNETNFEWQNSELERPEYDNARTGMKKIIILIGEAKLKKLGHHKKEASQLIKNITSEIVILLPCDY